MLETIKHFDTNLFFLINSNHNDLMDFVFWWLSDRNIWIPLYLLIIILLIKSYKKKAIYYIIAIALAVGLSDFVASQILKPLVKRLRPTHEFSTQSYVHTLHNYTGGDYGMASSHAAITFSLAMLLWLFFHRKLKFIGWIFVWSILVSYSRIYLGVHYPADVLVGALIGIFSALIIFKIFLNLKFDKKL